MNDQYPPKALVKAWIKLLDDNYVSAIRKHLITANIERIFGSLEVAETYLTDNN